MVNATYWAPCRKWELRGDLPVSSFGRTPQSATEAPKRESVERLANNHEFSINGSLIRAVKGLLMRAKRE